MAESNLLPFQRHSLDKLLSEIQEMGPTARGVISVILKADGGGHFRISGFTGKADLFTVLGLLDWVKADVMRDILDSAVEK